MYIPMITLELIDIKFILTSFFMKINIFDIVTIIAMIKAFNYEKIAFEKSDKRNDFIFLLKMYKKIINDFQDYIEEKNKIDAINNFKKLDILMDTKEEFFVVNKLYEMGFDLKESKKYKSILDYNEDDIYLFNKCIYYSFIINYVIKNKYRNMPIKENHNNNFICYSFKIDEHYLNPKTIVYILD